MNDNEFIVDDVDNNNDVILLMLMLLFCYIKCLQNVLMKSLNVSGEVAIFIIILNLCYNEKIIYEINYNITVIA